MGFGAHFRVDDFGSAPVWSDLEHVVAAPPNDIEIAGTIHCDALRIVEPMPWSHTGGIDDLGDRLSLRGFNRNC